MTVSTEIKLENNFKNFESQWQHFSHNDETIEQGFLLCDETEDSANPEEEKEEEEEEEEEEEKGKEKSTPPSPRYTSRLQKWKNNWHFFTLPSGGKTC